MKRFKYRLQPLLRLAEIRETEAKRDLGERLRDRNEQEAHLHEAERQEAAFVQKFYATNRTGKIDPIMVRRYQTYQNALGMKVSEVHGKLREEDEKVDEAREKLKTARCKTQIYENMRQRAFEKYRSESMKTENREIDDMAIMRRKRESGRAANLLLALAASAFVAMLLSFGALFAMGNLDAHKLKLITMILRYKEDHQNQVFIGGEKKPYLINANELVELKRKAREYDRIQAEDVDDESPLTNEVLEIHRDILSRFQEPVARDVKDLKDEREKIEKHLKRLQLQQDMLQQRKTQFEDLVRSREEGSVAQAKQGIMKSLTSIDPEEAAAILTENKTFAELQNSPDEKNRLIAYIAGYLKEMATRQRAAIMQALGPEWSSAVNHYIEAQASLSSQ